MVVILDDAAPGLRPLFAHASDHEAGTVFPAHRHRRAQLVHAISGVMTVHAAEGRWVVPPGRAVWMPSHEEHEIRIATPVRMRTVFVEPDVDADLPRNCQVLQVSALLRELIVAAMELPPLYDLGGRDQRIMDLILDELKIAPRLDFHVPIPQHPRLARICGQFIADPAQPVDMESWADRLNMSSRTMARLFLRETGMGFGDWCRRARILLSLPRLADGASILTIALEHGYDSPSAFAAMFRRELGVPPSFYSPKRNIRSVE